MRFTVKTKPKGLSEPVSIEINLAASLDAYKDAYSEPAIMAILEEYIISQAKKMLINEIKSGRAVETLQAYMDEHFSPIPTRVAKKLETAKRSIEAMNDPELREHVKWLERYTQEKRGV